MSGLPRNDSFDGANWNDFYHEYMLTPKDRRLFHYHLILKNLNAPNALIRALNYLFGSTIKQYQTVVCDLKSFKPNKKIRYALRHDTTDEVQRVFNCNTIENFLHAQRERKGLLSGPKGNLLALQTRGCVITYAAFKDNKIVGCLSIAPGKQWITELMAAGVQDAIKMKVIEDYRGTHDYYDLAGYDGSERSRFKKKWGVVTEVQL